jgi:hypothetical protein
MGVATGYAGWAAAYPVDFSSIEVYTVLCCNIAQELFSISRRFIYIVCIQSESFLSAVRLDVDSFSAAQRPSRDSMWELSK